MDIQGLQDKLEIQELLARYARGVDDRDWDLYRSVFTEDAHIDYTSAGAIAGPRDEVAAFLAKVFVSIPWSQHFITNIEIALDGDAAHVRAMFYNPLQLPGMDEPASVAATTTTIWCAPRTVGRAGASSKRTAGS